MAEKWRQVNRTRSKIIVTINFRHLICFSSLKNMKIARFGDFQLAKVGTVGHQYKSYAQAGTLELTPKLGRFVLISYDLAL